jgi:hypothetical protein
LGGKDDIIVSFNVMRKEVLLIGTNDGIYVIDGEVKVFILHKKSIYFFPGGAGVIGGLIIARVYSNFNFVAVC